MPARHARPAPAAAPAHASDGPAERERLADRAMLDAQGLVRAVHAAAAPAGATYTVVVPPPRTVRTIAGLLDEMTGPPAWPDLGRLRALVVALAAAVDPTRSPAELWGWCAGLTTAPTDGDPDRAEDGPADPDRPEPRGRVGDHLEDEDGQREVRAVVLTTRRSALIADLADDHRRRHGPRSCPHPCSRPGCAEAARVWEQLRRHRRRMHAHRQGSPARPRKENSLMQVTIDGHLVTLADAEVVVAEQVVAVVDHVSRVLVVGLGGSGPRYTADTSRDLAAAAGRLADLLGNGRPRPPLRWPVVREAAAHWSRHYPAGRLLPPPGGATRQEGGG